MARNCKVIVTCFMGRTVRETTTVCGSPPGFFNHSQNFPDEESVLDLVKLNYELECESDPGVECDTIIVNNDIGWKKGNDYLASIDNADTCAGKLRVLNRENYGRSFGGYNRAFERFRDEYDYWIFTEDDILIIKENYFQTCIKAFEEGEDIGFVAIQGLSNMGLGKPILHAHSGAGISHTNVLDALYNKLGMLPHSRKDQSQSYAAIIENGEMAFTNEIFKLGYDLATVSEKTPLYIYAYDYLRGLRWEHYRLLNEQLSNKLQEMAQQSQASDTHP